VIRRDDFKSYISVVKDWLRVHYTSCRSAPESGELPAGDVLVIDDVQSPEPLSQRHRLLGGAPALIQSRISAERHFLRLPSRMGCGSLPVASRRETWRIEIPSI
jgi:hypothetical protein